MSHEPRRPPAIQAFVDTIADLLTRTELSQIHIARKLGYVNPNIITMFKQGRTRVPSEKVVPLARVLGQDPEMMLRQWFLAYMPETLPDIENHLVRPPHNMESIDAAYLTDQVRV